MARLILGGVLLVAGILTIMDLDQSIVAVKAYDFPISDSLEIFLGYALPIVEIVMGLIIVSGMLTRWSAMLGGLMMIAYIAAISSAWVRGLNIDCGCLTPGGVLDPGQGTKYLQDILRDIGFLICAVWLVIFPTSPVSLDSWIASPVDKEI